MSTLKNIIVKPLEWHLAFLGVFVISLFYLQIVSAPTFFMALIGISAFNYLEYDTALNVVYGCSFIGLVLGVLWAERIRRTLGIVTFTAYLLSTPEIDGWRDSAGNKIQRKVT
ncbi:hypothetical protein [Thalassomonas haliotis]|uniref:Uncharacterized protein n=1 Tax=Thalassomonas haliotis TaxID=485448 RepID=A0ABY7VB83_9GAMM|nr:hypothetical protein [Thalassomonas haliotis]WDE10642.1 hypothetical protein H3N35_20640 [Thalassomonas haliotis]